MQSFERFLSIHPPADGVRPCSEKECSPYAGRVAPSVLEFWLVVGRGSFSDGLLHFVDPAQWEQTLDAWLGGPDPRRIPIARSAFGDLFYYRNKGLRKLDGVQARMEDVCRLDMHYRCVEVCTWSAESFLEGYLCDPGVVRDVLRKPLFDDALARVGRPGADEAYDFTPALVHGGAEDAASVVRGHAEEQAARLYRL